MVGGYFQYNDLNDRFVGETHPKDFNGSNWLSRTSNHV